jgi:hypothetical protein
MYTSRELTAVFQNTVDASRERLGGDCVSTNISFRMNALFGLLASIQQMSRLRSAIARNDGQNKQ